MANIFLHVTVTAKLALVMVNSGNIGHQSLIDISGRIFVFTSSRAIGEGGGGWGWVVVVSVTVVPNAKQCCHLS